MTYKVLSNINYKNLDQNSLKSFASSLLFVGVSKNSNRNEIKQAIEQIFKVKVMKINTSILRGKIKSFKGSVGYRNDIKKAIVTLKEGNTIDAALEIK